MTLVTLVPSHGNVGPTKFVQRVILSCASELATYVFKSLLLEPKGHDLGHFGKKPWECGPYQVCSKSNPKLTLT